MNDDFLMVLIAIIVSVCLTMLVVIVVVNGNWQNDCQKIGAHVSYDGKSYICKERDK